MGIPTGTIVLICMLHNILELIAGFVCFVSFPCLFMQCCTLRCVIFSNNKVFVFFLLGLQLIRSACTCLESIRTETKFQAVLADYVEEISTHVDTNNETELCRIYFSCIDSVCGEMKNRFGKNNCELMEALNDLDPVQATFLDVSKVKPLLDLTKTPALDSEFKVARNFLKTQMQVSSPPDGEK